MINPRRLFLTQLTVLTGTVALSKPTLVTTRFRNLLSADGSLAIYHSNDLNGALDTVGHDLGGLKQFQSILASEKLKGLVLDAGGFLNGSKGPADQKNMVRLMNTAGYHAAGLSSRELSGGQAQLASLAPLMQFKLVNCNHIFDNELAGLIKPYIVMVHGNLRVGITGVCSKLKGLSHSGPIESANRTAKLLKNQEKCDLVICLSHLGSNRSGSLPDNHELAAASENIDLIIGGENEAVNTNSLILKNNLNEEVILTQGAPNGLLTGRTIITFNGDKQKTCIRLKQFIPGSPSGQHLSVSLARVRQLKERIVSV